MKTTNIILASALIAISSATQLPAAENSDAGSIISTIDQKNLPDFNKLILKEIAKYPTDGTHDYWWPKKDEAAGDFSGSSKDVYLQGTKVMSGEPAKRTFCCGLTLEVFADVYDNYLKTHPEFKSPLTPTQWKDFQNQWFVREANGDGPGDALKSYKLGRSINKAEVLPGDFVQLWRQPKEGAKVGSGHSVIFLSWTKDENGNISGIHYWSTQTSTKGIHERTELFGPPTEAGAIDEAHTYFSRFDPAPPQK